MAKKKLTIIEPATHYTKCINPYFSEVWNEIKKAELRFNDRDYKVGDIVFQQEYFTNIEYFSGAEIKMRITHVLKDYPALSPGFCMYSFEIIEKIRCNKNLIGHLKP